MGGGYLRVSEGLGWVYLTNFRSSWGVVLRGRPIGFGGLGGVLKSWTVLCTSLEGARRGVFWPDFLQNTPGSNLGEASTADVECITNFLRPFLHNMEVDYLCLHVGSKLPRHGAKGLQRNELKSPGRAAFAASGWGLRRTITGD